MAVASLTVLTDGYVLEGNTITLGSQQTSIAIASGALTILCDLSGNALVKSGDGTLVLGGVDSYSVCTTIGDGMLQLQDGSLLPAGTALAVNGGILDLGGATVAGLTTVTLTSGSIDDGSIVASGAYDFYSGSVPANLAGTAFLDSLGPGTVILAGQNTYSGGTNAIAGTLVAANQDSLPGAAIGPGTVIVQPTLYWSGSGDWTSGPWELADGTPTPWIDGSSVVLAAGSDIGISGLVNVSTIRVAGDATIGGGTLALSSGSICVLAGTVTIHAELSGSGLVKTGAGTLDLMTPPATAPVIDGGQVIGPGAIFSNNESLSAIDPAMFALVQSLFVDPSINRADMIQILQSAVVDGAVTPAALGALEMLTTPQNEARLNMPAYVAVLAGDVVQGNPANANYQGAPLGNLADQGSGQAMARALYDLVGKWFFGTDLPAVPAGITYNIVAGALYGNSPTQTPTSADMHQGCLGDCYLISALGAIADSSPSAIENMIIPNGVENGSESWTVRFYYQNASGGYVADYVTVNALLPGFYGYPVFAGPGADGSWWMPLVEKAYAQWNATGHEGRDGQNAYESLTGGCMQAVDAQVLGCTATTYWPAGAPAAEQAVIAALNSGEAVTAAIFVSGDGTQFNALDLVSDHAYEVAGYDPTSQTFQLENPWGCHEPQPLTWHDLCAYGGWLAVAEPSSAVATVSPTSSLSAQAVQAATVATAAKRQGTPVDAACLADTALQGDFPSMDSTLEARIRALDLVLAMSSR